MGTDGRTDGWTGTPGGAAPSAPGALQALSHPADDSEPGSHSPAPRFPAGSAAAEAVAGEQASRKSRLPSRGCCCDGDRDSDRPGTSPRPPHTGPRRLCLRSPPARTMKWMFKEDHALGKGGSGPGAAPLPSVSCVAICPGRLHLAVVLSGGGQPPAARTEGCCDALGRPPRKAGDPLGGGNMIAIPAGSRPCRRCPLGLGHQQYYYYAMTNYEFCLQSTDVSSPQKSEPNTPTVSR